MPLFPWDFDKWKETKTVSLKYTQEFLGVVCLGKQQEPDCCGEVPIVNPHLFNYQELVDLELRKQFVLD